MLDDQMKFNPLERKRPRPTSETPELFREKTRAPLRAPVRLQFDSFDRMRTGYTANVSRSGMFVSCATIRPVGTLLKFEIDLTLGEPPVSGLAEVVWVRLKQRSLERPPGMGIQFRYLQPDCVARLDVAVGEAIAKHGLLEEPEASKDGIAQRTGRLRVEIENALGDCLGTDAFSEGDCWSGPGGSIRPRVPAPYSEDG